MAGSHCLNDRQTCIVSHINFTLYYINIKNLTVCKLRLRTIFVISHTHHKKVNKYLASHLHSPQNDAKYYVVALSTLQMVLSFHDR